MMSLNDEELRAKTPYFREKLKNGFSLDDILTEAFAVAGRLPPYFANGPLMFR